MALATLAAIRSKVRKLTRSPSVNQITDASIDEYVDTFVSYDLPETLRLFTLHKPVVFNVEPNIDRYTVSSVLGDVNSYITFNPPVYIAGVKALFSQSEDEFYNIYPFNSSIQATANTGDGATQNFTGTLSSIPVARGKVAFTSIATNNDGLILSDSGTLNGTLVGDGTGTINYITGVYTLNFNSPPATGQPIRSQTFPYQAAKPNSVLYYDNAFTFRPIPDQVYEVQIESYVRPTQLINSGDEPELEQWWQYIAYGATRLILQDRMDVETVQMIMPELKRQEILVLRRTVVQQTNQRSATIYTENSQVGNGFYGTGF